MYCDNCHRHCPDNFVNCPYCSAPLKSDKRKKPEKFVKKKERKKHLTLKSVVIIAVVVAFLLAVSAMITGALTGSKPDKLVKKMVTAIQTNDSELYYSLYDEHIKSYYKDNFYYGDEETFEALTNPLKESREFYQSKCGDDFTLKYKIINIEYLTEEELQQHNETLESLCGYKKFSDKTAVMEFEIIADGEQGTYKSVYSYFYCSRIGGKWYKMLLPTSTTN